MSLISFDIVEENARRNTDYNITFHVTIDDVLIRNPDYKLINFMDIYKFKWIKSEKVFKHYGNYTRNKHTD